MKYLFTCLLLSLAAIAIAQQPSSSADKKLHTYLITENMGIYPKSEGVLNIQLVQNLKGIGVIEDKKSPLDLEVIYFVFKYTPKGQSPIEFPIEGNLFPEGLKTKFFSNPKSGDKIVIEQIRIRNSDKYTGPGKGITVMEYIVK